MRDSREVFTPISKTRGFLGEVLMVAVAILAFLGDSTRTGLRISLLIEMLSSDSGSGFGLGGDLGAA